MRIATVPMSLKYLMTGQMKYMREHGFDVSMVSAKGPEIQEVVENEGCPHHVIPMTRNISPFADLVCLFRFIRLFRQHRPHIIHTHTPKAGLMGMVAGWLCRVPVRIHTLAGWRLLNESGWRARIIYVIEKITFWTAHEVWPNSFSLSEYLKEIDFCDESMIQVIGNGSSNGIDLAEYSPSAIGEHRLLEIKKQIKYDSRFTYLLYAGRIVAEKGVEELVHVFRRLKRSHPNLKLLLVGPREDHIDPIAPETIAAIKEDDNIIDIGFSPDVKYFMAIADILVHPSHREGFPNVPLQAGAMNCPVVCSNIGGNIDLVDHESTGLLFEVRNESDMLNNLSQALLDRPRMTQMADQLRDRVEASFERSYVHECMFTEYQRLILERLP